MRSDSPIMQITAGAKGWYAGHRRLDILRAIDLEVYAGESLAIMGPSGAGKSTLLHILGFLTRMEHGALYFEGQPATTMDSAMVHRIRRQIGMIFQDAKLIPSMKLIENVCMPLAHRGIWAKRQKSMALEALEQVGLSDRTQHRPHQLSGGEQTRAAIARALVLQPRVILADEPTGNLDSRTGDTISDLLLQTVSPRRALVLVTHNHDLARKADRVVYMRDGRIHGSADS